MMDRNKKGQFTKGQGSWNKGTKGVMKPNKTTFKKGQNIGNTNGFKKGVEPWNKGKEVLALKGHQHGFKKGQQSWNKGLRLEEMENERNPAWKGDDVSYSGLHKWVARHLGKPDKCEFCENNGLSGGKIHWANKSHEYERDLNDWIRLCVPCHIQYDKKVGV